MDTPSIHEYIHHLHFFSFFPSFSLSFFSFVCSRLGAGEGLWLAPPGMGLWVWTLGESQAAERDKGAGDGTWGGTTAGGAGRDTGHHTLGRMDVVLRRRTQPGVHQTSGLQSTQQVKVRTDQEKQIRSWREKRNGGEGGGGIFRGKQRAEDWDVTGVMTQGHIFVIFSVVLCGLLCCCSSLPDEGGGATTLRLFFSLQVLLLPAWGWCYHRWCLPRCWRADWCMDWWSYYKWPPLKTFTLSSLDPTPNSTRLCHMSL